MKAALSRYCYVFIVALGLACGFLFACPTFSLAATPCTQPVMVAEVAPTDAAAPSTDTTADANTNAATEDEAAQTQAKTPVSQRVAFCVVLVIVMFGSYYSYRKVGGKRRGEE